MPKTQTKPQRPNYRAIAQASLEREEQWKARLEEVEIERDTLNATGKLKAAVIDGMRDRATDLQRNLRLTNLQGHHVKLLLDRLAQRYVGFKLEAQALTIDQANAWLKSERDSVEAQLEDIKQRALAEFKEEEARNLAGPGQQAEAPR